MNEKTIQKKTSKTIPVLKRKTLREQIKSYILNKIMSGEYHAGERIIENALAQQLGVSQAPVREAIRDLVMMGYLEAEPFKGTTVQDFSGKRLREVYSVRAALESLAARDAASLLTEEDFQELHRIYKAMLKVAKENNLEKTVAYNIEFHEYILRVSGDELIYRLWQTMQLGHWTYFSTLRSKKDLEALARTHVSLMEALKTNDPLIAMEAMRAHIENAIPKEDLEP